MALVLAALGVPLASPSVVAQQPVQVSIAASPANPLVGQAVTLFATVSNAPAGPGPSYGWQMNEGSGWITWGGGANFSYLAARPEIWAFRVTVTYGSGASATSAPITVAWAPAPTESSFDFAVTGESAPQTARSQTKTGPDAPGSLTVVRATSDTPMNPALDVSWTTPADNGFAITKYNVFYGTDVNNMTRVRPDPGATATSVRLTNLTAGATYHVRVLAFAGNSGDHGVPGDRADTTATTNRPPTASSVSFLGGTLGMGGAFTWHEAAPHGSGSYFTDPDGDTLTYSASAQHPALLGVSVSGTAGSAVLTANLLNQGASKVNYVANDGYGGQVTRSANITITAKTSRSIAENSAAGTNVGTPVTGTPYDDGDDQTDDALSYTLTGKAQNSGLFVIDSATGQISVKTGAKLDYETDDSNREIEYWQGEVFSKFYRGKVNYTVGGHAAAIEVLIAVTDVEVGKPAAPTVTRTTSTEPMNPALDATWAAPAANGTTITGYEAQYRKQGETTWTDYAGSIVGRTLTLPAREAGATYEVRVRAVAWENGEPDIALSVSPASFAEGANPPPRSR